MALNVTPSKQVGLVVATPRLGPQSVPFLELMGSAKAAAAIDSLKMESPVKKLDLGIADKENQPFDATTIADEVATSPAPIIKEIKKIEEPKPAVAPTIKAEEADEPLLQENPQRFVLFPIKYHEVRDAPQRAK